MSRTISSWSFSRLVEDYETCPYKAYLLYVEKRKKPQQTESPALIRGKAVHLGAEQFVRGEIAELPTELKKVAKDAERYRDLYAQGHVIVEDNWAFTRDWTPTGWMDPDCWVRSKLDVFYRETSTHGEVLDWKTGKKFGNEVKHSQQGMLYGINAMLKFPELETVTAIFSYTDLGQETKKEYTRAVLMRMLPSWTARGRAMTEATEFKAKPSKITCRFCSFGPNNGGDRSCPWGVEV